MEFYQQYVCSTMDMLLHYTNASLPSFPRINRVLQTVVIIGAVSVSMVVHDQEPLNGVVPLVSHVVNAMS